MHFMRTSYNGYASYSMHMNEIQLKRNKKTDIEYVCICQIPPPPPPMMLRTKKCFLVGACARQPYTARLLLLHSPRHNAVGLTVGYEILPAIGWHHFFLMVGVE